MKILVPVDGSRYTKRMLSYIAAHDELLGPGHDYVFFTAIAPIPPRAACFLEHDAIESYYRDQAESVLKPLTAFADQQHWNYRTASAHGTAAVAIAEYASKEKPDLIVMGTHGHSPIGNVLLGSVATGVLARCKQPVLLVR